MHVIYNIKNNDIKKKNKRSNIEKLLGGIIYAEGRRRRIVATHLAYMSLG